MKKEIKTTNSVKKLYLLVSILPVNKRDVFMDLTEKFNVNYHISFLGNGSASSEMLALPLSLDRIMGLKNYLFLADLGGKAWKKN